MLSEVILYTHFTWSHYNTVNLQSDARQADMKIFRFLIRNNQKYSIKQFRNPHSMVNAVRIMTYNLN